MTRDYPLKEVDRSRTLVAAAANNIRNEILRGNLLPGESLHEVELSKSLNISRGSVREALRLLGQEGLIEVIPYRGAFVTKLSPKKVEEIYTLRALLEPYSVRLALENQGYSHGDLIEMESLVSKLGEYEKSGEYYLQIETDIKFHELTSQGSGHSLLIDVLSNLQSLTLMFILNTKLYRSDMVPDEVSHRSIYEGILNGDPQLAEEIVRKHIFDAGSSLLKRMEELGWDGDYRSLPT